MTRVLRQVAAAPAAPQSNAELLRRSHEIGGAVGAIKDLSFAFERWHQDMNALMDQNRVMRASGDELHSIVRHMVMLSMNAKIEAAKAGGAAMGFVVVATEMRNVSDRAGRLSKDFANGLHRNDLVTTATFQDIQASGKMMMAAISGLEALIKQLQAKLADPPS
jgi:hypothetical protein